MTERWLPVVGYEGAYEVSDQGRVRSLERRVTVCRGDQVFNITRKPVILKPGADPGGYLKFVLCREGVTRIFLAHRLVATAFVPNPHNHPQVDHLDGSRSNNAAVNLEWTTQSTNILRAIARGTFIVPDRRGLRRAS